MIDSLIILIICSIACSMLGVFLVLRKLSMISDAIAHSVLLGIVIAVLIVKSLTSIWLIVGAAVFGLLTVISIEILINTRLVKNDASVGIVFPLFFSLGVILISKYGRTIQMDTDCVIMGEVIFASLHRMDFLGISLPIAMVQMGIVMIINLLFVAVYFKELKVTSFDPEFAALAGFSVTLMGYALMSLVSVTTVVAFESVGAILVIAFMISPAATATLITKDLKYTLLASAVIGTLNSLLGWYIAIKLNVSMSGTVAFLMGLVFVLVLVFRKGGVISHEIKRIKQRRELHLNAFLMHLSFHQDKKEIEHGVETIYEHLNWSHRKIARYVKILKSRGLIQLATKRKYYELTAQGHEKISEIM